MDYPLEERKPLVSPEAIETYFEHLFHGVDWGVNDFLCFRGIGENGTDQEGSSSVDDCIQPHWTTPHERAQDLCEKWAMYEHGAFVIPAILKDRSATASNVKALTAVMVDIDSGNTLEKLKWLFKHLGRPTMVVKSGGRTTCNNYKVHCYYALTTPCEEIGRVVILRDKLARAVGGDLSFGLGTDNNPYGRAHQPIRIAGSVHAKNSNPITCTIDDGSYEPFEIDWLETKISRLPSAEWTLKKAPKVYDIKENSGSLFSPEASYAPSGEYKNAFENEIHEGGEPPHTRWHTFNTVAGEHIRQFRLGELSESEARIKTWDWMETKMVPPWPENKFDQQWNGLVNYDKAKNPAVSKAPEPEPEPEPTQEPERSLKDWEVHKWFDPQNVPRRKWLVQGLIMAGKPQSFVAGGGAGKTYELLDLGTKIASWKVDREDSWMGQSIKRGGTVVLILHEDDMEEIQIRMSELGLADRIKEAGHKLIILPTLNLGGAFSLVTKDLAGNTVQTTQWKNLKSMLKNIPDLCWFAIDTYAMIAHGSENDPSTIRDIISEVSDVCQDTGAAFTLTHHISKGVRGEPIKTREDMEIAVRGSTAFLGCFRVNLGMWQAHDYRDTASALGIAEPEAKNFWKLGVIKANNPEVMQGERLLMRDGVHFVDVTEETMEGKPGYSEINAWLLLAIREAAERGHPYSSSGRGSANGLFARRSELPTAVQRGETELKAATGSLLKSGAIQLCGAKGSSSKKWLDVPDGPLASDDAGAELDSGAYQDRPDWSSYEYNETLGIVAKK